MVETPVQMVGVHKISKIENLLLARWKATMNIRTYIGASIAQTLATKNTFILLQKMPSLVEGEG